MHCGSDRQPCDWVLDEQDQNLIIFDIVEVATHFARLVDSQPNFPENQDRQERKFSILQLKN